MQVWRWVRTAQLCGDAVESSRRLDALELHDLVLRSPVICFIRELPCDFCDGNGASLNALEGPVVFDCSVLSKLLRAKLLVRSGIFDGTVRTRRSPPVDLGALRSRAGGAAV